jgi:hypothetical protein
MPGMGSTVENPRISSKRRSILPYCPTALLPYCPTALLPYFLKTTPCVRYRTREHPHNGAPLRPTLQDLLGFRQQMLPDPRGRVGRQGTPKA